MYDLVNKRFWLFLVSGIVILISVISLVTPLGHLRLGTEFSPGTQMRVTFPQNIKVSDLEQEMASLGYSNASVRTETPIGGGKTDYVIVIPAKNGATLTDAEQTDIVTGLKSRFGEGTESQGFESVSPAVASQTIFWTAVAVIIAALGMLIYIIWAFRKMPHPLRYGACAIIALLHDLIVAIGIFSLIGAFFGWQVNLMFITGLLTILGYSINNTIVVFDRIRENVKMGISSNFEVIVNDSVIASMGRALNTSFTTLIGLLALLLIVSGSIEDFAVVLLIGIIAGTYDSICIAPMLLVVWEKKEWGRFIGLGRKAKAAA